MKRCGLLALALFALCGPAMAQEPFLPGQVKSQALAEWIWHPPCSHVGIMPLTSAPNASLSADPVWTVGEAVLGGCQVFISRAKLLAYATPLVSIATHHSGRVREQEIITCTIIVHEYGHLAGYYNAVGVPDPSVPGGIDHTHSPDPNSVMAPDGGQSSYPPCRRQFPLPRHRYVARRADDLDAQDVRQRHVLRGL